MADSTLPVTPVRLTQTVKKGGCAAKLAAGTLSSLLGALPRQTHPDLLVGTDFLDDAAVWRLSAEQVMIQTLDFFTPVLDDPYDFGAVAAANALSDVFAMGGAPTTALTILAYPSELPGGVLGALMAGAVAKVNEAGALLVGGHSIDDDTLKLGFSVTGLAHPDKLWSNRGARVGDALVLTKAVGTGTLTGALKSGELSYADLGEAVASMKQLNDLSLGAELHRAVHAATDVTGFGVLGHALHLAQGSSVTLSVSAAELPLLEHAAETLERGILTRAHHSNTAYASPHVAGRERVSETSWWALTDPQTSGGLLLAVAPERVGDLLAAVRPRFARATVIGRVAARDARGALVVY